MSIQAIKKIDGIRFSVWSPTEVRKYSVAEITAPETYDEDGMSVQGGLMDGRLGTLEPGQKSLIWRSKHRFTPRVGGVTLCKDCILTGGFK